MPKLTKSIAEFDYRICGIPCRIAVTDHEPFVPGRYSGPPEDCYPDEGGYSEYRVLDRKGYIAEWLERKITGNMEDEIQNEIAERFYKEPEWDVDDDYYRSPDY